MANDRSETLEKLMHDGTVWIDDGEYVGRAADGQVVGLGSVGNESSLESLLAERPSPADW